MKNDIVQVSRSCHSQTLANRERYQAHILAEEKEMEGIALRRRGFHQILVAQRKGVGVHHQGGRMSGTAGLRKGLQIAGEAAAAVLHKNQEIRRAGDFIEPQVFKV